MLADNVLALIASCAIKKVTIINLLRGMEMVIITIEQSGHHIIVEIVKIKQNIYVLSGGIQNANDYWVDLQAMCDDKKKKEKR